MEDKKPLINSNTIYLTSKHTLLFQLIMIIIFISTIFFLGFIVKSAIAANSILIALPFILFIIYHVLRRIYFEYKCNLIYFDKNKLTTIRISKFRKEYGLKDIEYIKIRNNNLKSYQVVEIEIAPFYDKYFFHPKGYKGMSTINDKSFVPQSIVDLRIAIENAKQ